MPSHELSYDPLFHILHIILYRISFNFKKKKKIDTSLQSTYPNGFVHKLMSHQHLAQHPLRKTKQKKSINMPPPYIQQQQKNAGFWNKQHPLPRQSTSREKLRDVIFFFIDTNLPHSPSSQSFPGRQANLKSHPKRIDRTPSPTIRPTIPTRTDTQSHTLQTSTHGGGGNSP